MYKLNELHILKSKDLKYQCSVIDELSDHVIDCENIHYDLLYFIPQNLQEIFNKYSDIIFIRYILLSIVAADIASIPSRKSIQSHMNDFTFLLNHYNVDRDNVILISPYAEHFTKILSNCLNE